MRWMVALLLAGCTACGEVKPVKENSVSPPASADLRVAPHLEHWRVLPGGKGWPVNHCVFTESGDSLFYGNEFGIWKYDMAKGLAVELPANLYSTFAISPDATKIATIKNGNELLITGSGSWNQIKTIKFSVFDEITSLVFSPDGDTIVVTFVRFVPLFPRMGKACIIDCRSGNIKATIHANEPVFCSAYSSNGGILALGGGRVGPLHGMMGCGVLRVIDCKTGKVLKILDNVDGGPIESLAISTRREALATAGAQGMVKLWNLRTAVPRRSFVSQSYISPQVSFDPDGSILFAANSNEIDSWWVESGARTEAFAPGSAGAFIAFSKDGKYVATGIGSASLPAVRDHGIEIWKSSPPFSPLHGNSREFKRVTTDCGDGKRIQTGHY